MMQHAIDRSYRVANEARTPPSEIIPRCESPPENKSQAVLYLAAAIGNQLGCDLAEIRAREINRRISEVDGNA